MIQQPSRGLQFLFHGSYSFEKAPPLEEILIVAQGTGVELMDESIRAHTIVCFETVDLLFDVG